MAREVVGSVVEVLGGEGSLIDRDIARICFADDVLLN